MRTTFTIFSMLWLTSFALFADTGQPNLSWKEHRRKAEKSLEEGQFITAAQHFEAAWQLKRTQKELVFQAGSLYGQGRDYAKAVQLLAYVKDDIKNFPAARYRYALALKQSGQYDEAARELVIAINTYVGKDRNEVVERLQHEISGCTLGIQLEANVESNSVYKVKIEHLNDNINSSKAEFAPVLFGNDILYFTSDKQGTFGVHRSQQIGGEWLASDMPKFPLDHTRPFGNGCFSPDGNRFYYSQQELDAKKNKFSAIYVIKRLETGWSQPIRLRNYINAEGFTTTHPFVVHQDGMEILYFSSNRRNGQGGMDIWCASREIDSPDMDFTVPRNLGKTINSSSDEVTPFYDLEHEMLYFASNGKNSIGGLDIFKAKNLGNKNWDTAVNLGFPYNSSADDYYFIQNGSKMGGFFASNRRFAGEKLSTIDDDIFSFTIEKRQPMLVKGTIMLQNHKVVNANVSLYEKRSKDDYRLLTNELVTDGDYEFLLLAQKSYKIEVEQEGYKMAVVDFITQDTTTSVVQDFMLEWMTQAAVATTSSEKPMGPAGDWSLEATEVPNGAKNVTKTGVYYKVQLAVVKQIDATYRRKLERLERFGQLEVEWLDEQQKRVTIGDFETLAKANEACKNIRLQSFKTAIVVKYENGKRVIPKS